jgi:hypothetical protein
VDGPAFDPDQQPRRTQSGAGAVRTGVLHHHLVEPFLHPRVGLATLTIAAVPALDPAGNAIEADLLAFVIVALDLCFGR